jgi:peptide chain release factor 2
MDIKELKTSISDLKKRVSDTLSVLDLENDENRIKEIEFLMKEKSFWNDPDNAKNITKEFSELKESIDFWEKMQQEINDLYEIVKEDIEDKDVSLRDDIEKHYNKILDELYKKEFLLKFTGKYDKKNAILSIHSGAGGDDAQDFAEILLRMYIKFCNKKDFKVEVINENKGQEAGIKSISLLITGKYSYGLLKNEYGVHRLIRLSPFDSDHARHTSFVLVEVLPELDETPEIVIKDNEIRIDVFLASGNGGQSVNTTYSAVRIVHIPTGISVSCQNERSQAQNKEFAFKILKSKLLKLKEEKLLDEKNKLKEDYSKIEWGSQIRTYVMHPYKQVRDHKTGYETPDIDSVLDGDIEQFQQLSNK